MEKITTIEMHTGGEPLRIITGGYPEVKGDTILDKVIYYSQHVYSPLMQWIHLVGLVGFVSSEMLN